MEFIFIIILLWFLFFKKAIVLYRPVGSKELELIKLSGFKAFPPRLPEQPIFYPVCNREYAEEIAVKWNKPMDGVAYIVRFFIEKKIYK